MLVVLSKALRYRTTSVLSDEPICLANLLGFDSQVVSKIPASDQAGRMMAFWRLTSNVPLRMLFMRKEKLCTPGFQWAQTTFCRRPTGVGEQKQFTTESNGWTTSKAEVTDHGLHCRMGGFAAHSNWNDHIPAWFVLQTTSGRWFKAWIEGDVSTTLTKDTCERRRYSHNSSNKNIMIMYPKKFSEDETPSVSLLVEEVELCRDGRHHVRSICSMLLGVASEKDCREWVEKRPEIPIYQVEQLAEETQWCHM
jgi:hypothetical protein